MRPAPRSCGFLLSPYFHKVHHCEKRGGKASMFHFDWRSLAQGRSPIFINDHWLRGVPPFVCGCQFLSITPTRLYQLCILECARAFYRILMLAHLQSVGDRGLPSLISFDSICGVSLSLSLSLSLYIYIYIYMGTSV